jgi:hypothetical protein
VNGDQHGVGALRDRLANGAEDRLGRALSDLLENPVISGAIGRAFDAREKAAQAQELAMGALNLPSAADIERLTRRLRSFSQRLEGIEDGVSQIDRSTGQRLGAIEEQLKAIAAKVQELTAEPAPVGPAAAKRPPTRASKPATKASRAGRSVGGKTADAKPATRAKSKSSKA